MLWAQVGSQGRVLQGWEQGRRGVVVGLSAGCRVQGATYLAWS